VKLRNTLTSRRNQAELFLLLLVFFVEAPLHSVVPEQRDN
jgi:hypothetical protein